MPERAEILAKARALQGHTWALEPEEEGTKWTGRAHGATFELTKPEGVVLEEVGDFSRLALTLKGTKKGKEQLRGEFILAFGAPTIETQAVRFKTPHIVIWDSAKALQPQ